MGRVHRFLGLEVGVILAQMTFPSSDRKAYAADITYGTNNEFGFDYLRDNMAWTVEEMVQRGHSFAIVDEVDSILIDEARTPLIISGPADQSLKWYSPDFAKPRPAPQEGRGPRGRHQDAHVGILDAGVAQKVEDWLGMENLYGPSTPPLVGFLNNAIRAKEPFEQDKGLRRPDGEVLIVDEHTGRIPPVAGTTRVCTRPSRPRRGGDQAENQTLATITLQNFFRMYDKLAGMTGTGHDRGRGVQPDLQTRCRPDPHESPNVRVDLSDVIYRTESGKVRGRRGGHPERQEKASRSWSAPPASRRANAVPLLKKAGIRHEVLNAKYHEREARSSRRPAARVPVTVATNMAGRGNRHHARRQPGDARERRPRGRAAWTRWRPRGLRGPGARTPTVARGRGAVRPSTEVAPGLTIWHRTPRVRGASTTTAWSVPAAGETPAPPGSSSHRGRPMRLFNATMI